MAIILSPSKLITLDESDIEIDISPLGEINDSSNKKFLMKIIFQDQGFEKIRHHPKSQIKLITSHSASFKTYEKSLGMVESINDKTIETEIDGMGGENFRINLFLLKPDKATKIADYNHLYRIKHSFFVPKPKDIHEIFEIDCSTIKTHSYVTIWINQKIHNIEKFLVTPEFKGYVLPTALRQALNYCFFEHYITEDTGALEFTNDQIDDDFKPLYTISMKYANKKKDEPWQKNPSDTDNFDEVKEFIKQAVNGMVKSTKLDKDFIDNIKNKTSEDDTDDD